GAFETLVEQLLERPCEGGFAGHLLHEMAVDVVIGDRVGDVDAELCGETAQVLDRGAGADDGAVHRISALPQYDAAPRCGPRLAVAAERIGRVWSVGEKFIGGKTVTRTHSVL